LVRSPREAELCAKQRKASRSYLRMGQPALRDHLNDLGVERATNRDFSSRNVRSSIARGRMELGRFTASIVPDLRPSGNPSARPRYLPDLEVAKFSMTAIDPCFTL